ncbi:MAG: molecular chaperone DnaK [Flavobacteriaceae bacterium]|jgi:molecular chaperone DnaK
MINSLIARSVEGELCFHGERDLIGEKAQEFLLKDLENVFGGFKRKMGTDEVFWANSIDRSNRT